MKSYFKHTNGESLTLNGESYTGFFNLVNGIPYTSQYYNSDSEELIWKSTFRGNLFENQLEFDNSFENIESITPYYSNVWDVLNTQGIEEMSNTLNRNNLVCYKGFHIFNPTVYNFETNSNCYYGMSSYSDSLIGNQTYKHVEPFTSFSEWSFLDTVFTGAVFVNSSDEFKYFCSTGDKNYVLRGSFDQGTPLEVIFFEDLHPDYTETPDYTYHIHNDEVERKFYTVNNDYIRIYDSSNYDNCENLPLIDKYPLNKTTTHEHIPARMRFKINEFSYKCSSRFHTDNDNNPLFIKFGKNYRTSVENGNIFLINKASNIKEKSFDTSTLSIITLDISPYTDDVIILYNHENDVKLKVLYAPDHTTITDFTLKNLEIDDTTKIKFGSVDSNQIYISTSSTVQTRALTNPVQPIGKMENGELLYFKRLTPNDAKEKYNKIQVKPNSYLYPSNNFNVLNFSETTKSTNMYMILHNIGRIYALKQPISNYLYSLVPSNLVKYFNNVNYSESSLGIHFNNIILNIIKDTINLLTSAEGKFRLESYKILILSLEEMNLEMKNLFMGGNETTNVITLQRILTNISNIQSKLLPS